MYICVCVCTDDADDERVFVADYFFASNWYENEDDHVGGEEEEIWDAHQCKRQIIFENFNVKCSFNYLFKQIFRFLLFLYLFLNFLFFFFFYFSYTLNFVQIIIVIQLFQFTVLLHFKIKFSKNFKNKN